MDLSETSHHYAVGGFHPVDIGDTLDDDNYKILHKLGHGGSATIWLARDRKWGCNVALKIVSAFQSEDCTDFQTMQSLATMPAACHPGRDYVQSLLHHFWVEGPNGRHICLVMEALGPSIALLREDNVILSITQSQMIALQTSQALAYLHSVGYGHGGKRTFHSREMKRRPALRV